MFGFRSRLDLLGRSDPITKEWFLTGSTSPSFNYSGSLWWLNPKCWKSHILAVWMQKIMCKTTIKTLLPGLVFFPPLVFFTWRLQTHTSFICEKSCPLTPGSTSIFVVPCVSYNSFLRDCASFVHFCWLEGPSYTCADLCAPVLA